MIPFSRDAFLHLVAQMNAWLWPGQFVALLLAIAIIVFSLRPQFHFERLPAFLARRGLGIRGHRLLRDALHIAELGSLGSRRAVCTAKPTFPVVRCPAELAQLTVQSRGAQLDRACDHGRARIGVSAVGPYHEKRRRGDADHIPDSLTVAENPLP